jgi:hypothetical protein
MTGFSLADYPKASVDALAERVGSRSELARQLAFAVAHTSTLPETAWASYPVLADTDLRLVRCFVCRTTHHGDDLWLYEPELTVSLEWETLTPAGMESLLSPDDATENTPICSAYPLAALSLGIDQILAYEHERAALMDVAFQAIIDREGASISHDVLVRLETLMRFLVPNALVPYYERVSGGFLRWLSIRARGDVKWAELTEIPEAPPTSDQRRGEIVLDRDPFESP